MPEQTPKNAAGGPCVARCSLSGLELCCALDVGHEYEHEANVDITAGPDDTDTPALVWWGDDGHAFVGSNKAVDTGRIG